MNYIVRPGKVYFNLGLISVIATILFGIWVKIEGEYMFRLFYLIWLLPLFLIFSISNFVFYFRKRIIVQDNKIIVRSILKKEKTWTFSDISEIRVYSTRGISRPIVLLHDNKKVVQIVTAYNGYFTFEQDLQEKCKDKFIYL